MALFKIILFDTPSKEKKDGTFPVTLKVTYKGKRKYFYLGYDAKPSQWNKSKFNSKYPDHNNCNDTLKESLSNAEAVRKEMAIEGHEFTLSEFEKRFRASGETTLTSLFHQKINDPHKPLGTSSIGRYKTTLNMLLHFKSDVQIREVNENYIYGFIKWLKTDRVLNIKGKNGKSRKVISHSCNETTIYNYLKDLRSVYNYAINNRLVNKNQYPFDKVNINKFKNETKKRAISLKQFRKIEKVEPKTSYGKLAKDIFVFSLYCRGINFADIIELKKDNIFKIDEDYYLEYYRAKTRKKFSMKLNPIVVKMIQSYFEDESFNQRGYIFPVLDQTIHVTEKMIFNRKKSMLKKINKALNEEIVEMANLNGVKLTTYVARHTYANELSRNDVPIGKISQALGHRSQDVTKTYLKSIADHELDEIDEKIFGE